MLRLINLLSLLLLSLSPLIFSPLFPTSPRTKEIGMWYIVLLSWPVFVVCFWINVRPRVRENIAADKRWLLGRLTSPEELKCSCILRQ